MNSQTTQSQKKFMNSQTTQSQKKLLQSSRKRYTRILNGLIKTVKRQKTWVLIGVKTTQMKLEASKAVIQHLDGKKIQNHEIDQQQTYRCVDKFQGDGKYTIEIYFRQEEKEHTYQIVVFDIPNTRNRVIVLPYPDFDVEKNQDLNVEFCLMLEFFVTFLRKSTKNVKLSEINRVQSANINNLENKFERKIKKCFQKVEVHQFCILTKKIVEANVKQILESPQYKGAFAIETQPKMMFRSLDNVFNDQFINLDDLRVVSNFRMSGKQADDIKNATKVYSQRFKDIQMMGLSSITPLFQIYAQAVSLVIQKNANDTFSQSFKATKDKKTSKFLIGLKQSTFNQCIKAWDIDFSLYKRQYQFNDYLKLSKTSEILLATQAKGSWIKHQELDAIPREVKIYHFVSQFAKICRLYSEKQYIFNENRARDQEINHLRECLHAMFSLLNEINFDDRISDQYKCQNIDGYYNFVDNLIDEIIAYNQVMSSGSGYTITSLAKTLIKERVCQQKLVLNCILSHNLLPDQPEPYYDTIIKIIEDNVDSMSGKQHGEDVFKKKCTFYKMRAMTYRAMYLIKHKNDLEKLYVAIKNLLKVYTHKQAQESNDNSIDFDNIILTIAKLLKKTGNPKLAMPIFKNLHRVIAFQDCMLEHTMTLPDSQQKWKFYFEHAVFFVQESFGEKAKFYYQLIFEQTNDQVLRVQAKKQVKEVDKKIQKQIEQKLEQDKKREVELEESWKQMVESLKVEGVNWRKNFGFRVKNGKVQTNIEKLC